MKRAEASYLHEKISVAHATGSRFSPLTRSDRLSLKNPKVQEPFLALYADILSNLINHFPKVNTYQI